MVSVAPGSLVDIVPASHTALAMSFYSFGTLNGPVTGPIIVCYGLEIPAIERKLTCLS
jgi:hypothetical protein